MQKIADLIKRFRLEAHPEGGYFRETYRSNGLITSGNPNWEFSSDRNFSTCIYFLLTSDSFSAFHRIKQDEIWHFYSGSPIRLHVIAEDGNTSHVIIGSNFLKNQVPQFVVPKGVYFAAEVVEQNSYAFTGCTVAPGFDFADFELPSREALLELFPEHQALITQFTREH